MAKGQHAVFVSSSGVWLGCHFLCSYFYSSLTIWWPVPSTDDSQCGMSHEEAQNDIFCSPGVWIHIDRHKVTCHQETLQEAMCLATNTRDLCTEELTVSSSCFLQVTHSSKPTLIDIRTVLLLFNNSTVMTEIGACWKPAKERLSASWHIILCDYNRETIARVTEGNSGAHI